MSKKVKFNKVTSLDLVANFRLVVFGMKCSALNLGNERLVKSCTNVLNSLNEFYNCLKDINK